MKADSISIANSAVWVELSFQENLVDHTKTTCCTITSCNWKSYGVEEQIDRDNKNEEFGKCRGPHWWEFNENFSALFSRQTTLVGSNIKSSKLSQSKRSVPIWCEEMGTHDFKI